MFELVVRDSVTGQILERIQGAIRSLQDFRPYFRRLRRPWYQTREQMFRDSGRAFGWPSYWQTAERFRYVYAKARITDQKVSELRVLRWHPREILRPSLVDPRHPKNVWDATPRALSMGTAYPPAANHDGGRGRAPEWAGGHAIPRRELVTLGRIFTGEAQIALGDHAAEIAAQIATVKGANTKVGLRSDQVNRLL